MEIHELGGTGMRVGVLAFDAAALGDGPGDPAPVLDAAIGAGLGVVDVDGCSPRGEERIGRALAGHRGRLHLFAGCGPPGLADWRAGSVLAGIEGSLRRLGTDCLDLVLLRDCPEDQLRRGEAIAGLEESRLRGHVRHLGYCGSGAAARYAVESGAFDVLRTPVNVADQWAIDLILPPARARGMGVIAGRPIAEAAWLYDEPPEGVLRRAYWDRLQRLDYPFLREDAGSALAIALRFALSVPGIGMASVSTTTPGRWAENVSMVEAGPLHDRDYEAIRSRWRRVADPDWASPA